MKSRPMIGLSDAFGVRAVRLRRLQYALAEMYAEAGYAEVIPPVVDRPETLHAGAGRFLADQTLVFSDPAGAGLLALRPDMTPQVARIAATSLQREAVLRLHYSGPVVQARVDVRSGSRQQWQTGVECLGIAGLEGDIEVLRLAARSLRLAGFTQPLLLLGHMGLIHALVEGSRHDLEAWVSCLNHRSPDDVQAMLDDDRLDAERGALLVALAHGMADADWLDRHRHAVSPRFAQAAGDLLALSQAAASEGIRVVADAAVLPRFLYHSGLVFQGFAAGAAQPLLHGGRYDAMMSAHGRDMPATGFSFDLWRWLDAGAEVRQ
ncbi:MAG: ATP phosphoribosyltransferase regulatory subunit [Zetaproteobacteria bacterium]|nr:MAG: ATP phosphoribosyltransferase regulatory subunit [Zetaproteobacteria bacterium]